MKSQGLFIVLLTFFGLSLYADDTIRRRPIYYFPPGGIGEGIEWRLSVGDGAEAETSTIACESDSTLVTINVPDMLYHLRIISDSVSFVGYESRLRLMSYDPLPLLLSLPIAYGDHHVSSYSGRGNYCQRYALEENGTLDVEADARGCIITDDCDTLPDVLRLHLIFSSAISQHLPTDTLAGNVNMKQRVDERYLWFARGYSYPVYETSCVTIYDDLMPVTCQKTAYCTLPSDQHTDGRIKSNILAADSIQGGNSNMPPALEYHVSVEGYAVKVAYTLNEEATLNALVCDRMGMVYRRASASGAAGSGGVLTMNVSGLKSGIYVLYMNVNGQVYNEKLEL